MIFSYFSPSLSKQLVLFFPPLPFQITICKCWGFSWKCYHLCQKCWNLSPRPCHHMSDFIIQRRHSGKACSQVTFFTLCHSEANVATFWGAEIAFLGKQKMWVLNIKAFFVKIAWTESLLPAFQWGLGVMVGFGASLSYTWTNTQGVTPVHGLVWQDQALRGKGSRERWSDST